MQSVKSVDPQAPVVENGDESHKEVAFDRVDAAQRSRFDWYLSPEFTQGLLEHMHRAKKKALRGDWEPS